MKNFLFGFILLAVFTTGFVATQSKVPRKKVVLISIDGLRPEFYLEDRFNAPLLKELASNGAIALGVIPVYPSLTYPNHTSLITGRYPDAHGIVTNNYFSWEAGPSSSWIFDANAVKVPTLHDFFREAGGKTAAVRWPVTVGAKNIDYLVPEIFSAKAYNVAEIYDLTAQNTDPALMNEIESNLNGLKFKDEHEMDAWAASASAYLLKAKKPDFIAIHLANVDHTEHAAGREGAETLAAVTDVDQNIKRILAEVDRDSTCVVITGDHGFMDITQNVRPNVLFVQKGWISLGPNGEVKDWQVIAQTGGGQAAIYVKDKSLLPQVAEVLRNNAGNIYQVLSQDQLRDLHSYGEASFGIDAKPGYAVSGSFKGDFVTSSGTLKGQHGYLPSYPEIHTGLIMQGCGEKPGTRWAEIQLVDIAGMIRKAALL